MTQFRSISTNICCASLLFQFCSLLYHKRFQITPSKRYFELKFYSKAFFPGDFKVRISVLFFAFLALTKSWAALNSPLIFEMWAVLNSVLIFRAWVTLYSSLTILLRRSLIYSFLKIVHTHFCISFFQKYFYWWVFCPMETFPTDFFFFFCIIMLIFII